MCSLESFLRLFIGAVDGVENVGLGRVTSLTAIAPVLPALFCHVLFLLFLFIFLLLQCANWNIIIVITITITITIISYMVYTELVRAY